MVVIDSYHQQAASTPDGPSSIDLSIWASKLQGLIERSLFPGGVLLIDRLPRFRIHQLVSWQTSCSSLPLLPLEECLYMKTAPQTRPDGPMRLPSEHSMAQADIDRYFASNLTRQSMHESHPTFVCLQYASWKLVLHTMQNIEEHIAQNEGKSSRRTARSRLLLTLESLSLVVSSHLS